MFFRPTLLVLVIRSANAVSSLGNEVHLESTVSDSQASRKPLIRREPRLSHEDLIQTALATNGEIHFRHPKNDLIARLLSPASHNLQSAPETLSTLEEVTVLKQRPADQRQLDVAVGVNVATEFALIILGQITFYVSILYLLNSSFDGVRARSWDVLSSTLAIFIAMLFFMSTKCAWKLMTNGKNSLDSTGISCSFARFIAAWMIGPALLRYFGRSDLSRKAWGLLTGFFIAFCGADAFGSLLQIDPYKKSPGNCFGGFVLAGFILLFLFFLASWTRFFITRSNMVDDDEERIKTVKRWASTWEENEIVYTSFILGQMLMTWVRFSISGPVSSPYDRPFDHKKSDGKPLFSATSTLIVLAALALMALGPFTRPDRRWIVRTFAEGTSQVITMFSGWLILSWGEWVWWYGLNRKREIEEIAPSDLASSMGLAITFSSTLLVFIFLTDVLARRLGIQSLFGSTFLRLSAAASLLIGLSWQRVFYIVITYAGAKLKGAELLVEITVALVVGLIVLPAWYLYILPIALEEAADVAKLMQSDEKKALLEDKDEEDKQEPEEADAKKDTEAPEAKEKEEPTTNEKDEPTTKDKEAVDEKVEKPSAEEPAAEKPVNPYVVRRSAAKAEESSEKPLNPYVARRSQKAHSNDDAKAESDDEKEDMAF